MSVDLPVTMSTLPLDPLGRPIPWFIADPSDLRIASGRKRHIGYNKSLCWICGQPMRRLRAFLGGPMSFHNRVFTDWSSHIDCARYAMCCCPALNGTMKRRAGKPIPQAALDSTPPGFIEELPLFQMLYATSRPVRLCDQTDLFFVGPPKFVEWWRCGVIVPSTNPELREAITMAKFAIEEALEREAKIDRRGRKWLDG